MKSRLKKIRSLGINYSNELHQEILLFKDLRNSIVHKNATLGKYPELKLIIENSNDLFSFDEKRNQFIITDSKVLLNNLKLIFKLLRDVYSSLGDIVK